MTIHQQRLLVEISEARENPVLSYLDEKLSRFAANRLERRHGERLIRMVLGALADIENFPRPTCSGMRATRTCRSTASFDCAGNLSSALFASPWPHSG